MEGGRCQQCPPGQKPGANQEKCICDQSQGLQIMTATECQCMSVILSVIMELSLESGNRKAATY